MNITTHTNVSPEYKHLPIHNNNVYTHNLSYSLMSTILHIYCCPSKIYLLSLQGLYATSTVALYLFLPYIIFTSTEAGLTSRRYRTPFISVTNVPEVHHRCFPNLSFLLENLALRNYRICSQSYWLTRTLPTLDTLMLLFFMRFCFGFMMR